MARFPLPWPRLGVSEYRAHADQPDLTTAFARNCRTLMGDTLRHQGGQRAGWRDFTSAPLEPGLHVDALVCCTVDLPKVEFSGPGLRPPSLVWGHLVPGLREALDLQIDRRGDIFVLDGNGSFQRVGPDGKAQTTMAFYVPQAEAVVKRIELDSSGNVYVASSHPQGYSGRVHRFERVEPDDDEDEVFYVKAWEWAGPWGVRDIRVSGGVLYVSRFYSEQTLGTARADLQAVAQLYATTPTQLYVAATPWPVSTIAVNEQGEVLGCSPANTKRTAILSDEGWNDGVVTWTPHELEDVTGYGAARRLHFWIDAFTLLDTHVDGSIVYTVPDRRWVQTTLDFNATAEISADQGALSGGADGPYLPVLDTSPRPLVQNDAAGGEYDTGVQLTDAQILAGLKHYHLHSIERPVYFRPSGAGNKPAIQFPGASPSAGGYGYATENINFGFLRTAGGHSEQGFKTDTDSPTDGVSNDDGTMRQVRGMVPKHAKAVYATFLVIRYNVREDFSEVVWHHRSDSGVQLALIMNGTASKLYASQGTPIAAPGLLSLYVGGENGAIVCADKTGTTGVPPISCDLLNDGTTYGTVAFNTARKQKTTERIAIVCIQHAGSDEYDSFNGTRTGLSLWRVNGRTADRFTMLGGPAGSPGRADVIGANIGQVWFDQHFALTNGEGYAFGPWKGELLEAVTILGSTSSAAAPNEVPVGWPGQPSGCTVPQDPNVAHQWTDMSWNGHGTYATDPVLYTLDASEIELWEGYLAHKWGVDHVLASEADVTPGTIAYATGTVQNWHPFGRTAAGVPRPPVGSPTAGNVVIGETGQALLSPKELLFKLDTSGQVAWALAGGGHGLGVQAGPDGTVCAVGRHDGASRVVAKRVRDLGRRVLIAGDRTWEVEDDRQPAARPVHGLAIDDASNLYWPRHIAEYEVQQRFTANPTPGTVFRTGAFGSVTRLHTFQAALTSMPGFVSVLIGGSIAESIQNLVQAVNNSGTPGLGSNYYYGPDIQVGPDPYVKAAYETAGGNHYLRWTHLGFDGQADLTTASAVTYPFTATPPGTHTYFGGVHIRFGGDTSSRVEMRYAKDGALAWERIVSEVNAGAEAMAVAIDPDLPKYPEGSDLKDVPEHVYVALRENTDQNGETVDNPVAPTVEKVRQVHRRQVIDADLSPRKTFYIGAAGGSLYNLSRGGKPARLTSSIGLLTRGSPFTKLFVYRQKVYGLDGMRYVVFDPQTGKAEEWKAEGAGKIPFGAKLGCVWNGRIVLSRTADDAHNLYMSERGNPLGWDANPPVLTPLSAWTGDSSGTLHFRTHGLVNTLMPLRDDLLLIGQDSAVQRLTGDPGGKGQLDLVMEGEGLAFGDCWALGPGGTGYAKGINGGVWRFRPDGGADRISLGWVEAQLQAIDLAHYDVEMAWDFHNEGLMVVVVPKDVGERIVTHFFWDGQNQGWWIDEMALPSLQPTCITTFDGDDPDDRSLVIGCEDGRVRFMHPDEKNDGGQRIVSEVWLGPYNLKAAGRVAVSKLELALASRYQGCLVELFAGDVADFRRPGPPLFAREIGPGYSGWLAARASGNHVWLRLSNGALGERWALEEATMIGRQAGRRRAR